MTYKKCRAPCVWAKVIVVPPDSGLDRKTVGKYHGWAEAQGFLEGPLPTLAALQQRLEET